GRRRRRTFCVSARPPPPPTAASIAAVDIGARRRATPRRVRRGGRSEDEEEDEETHGGGPCPERVRPGRGGGALAAGAHHPAGGVAELAAPFAPPRVTPRPRRGGTSGPGRARRRCPRRSGSGTSAACRRRASSPARPAPRRSSPARRGRAGPRTGPAFPASSSSAPSSSGTYQTSREPCLPHLESNDMLCTCKVRRMCRVKSSLSRGGRVREDREPRTCLVHVALLGSSILQAHDCPTTAPRRHRRALGARTPWRP
ncbi:unnamed protein product, partial [Prorocentrum cordatum]